MLVYLVCAAMKKRVVVGKLLDGTSDGSPFWRANLTDEQLGLKVLRFLADHVGKEVMVSSEHAVDAMDDLADYRAVDNEYGDPLF